MLTSYQWCIYLGLLQSPPQLSSTHGLWCPNLMHFFSFCRCNFILHTLFIPCLREYAWWLLIIYPHLQYLSNTKILLNITLPTTYSCISLSICRPSILHGFLFPYFIWILYSKHMFYNSYLELEVKIGCFIAYKDGAFWMDDCIQKECTINIQAGKCWSW